MLRRRGLLGCLPVLAAAGSSHAQPAPVQIYAAMTFRPALDHVLTAYREVGGSAIGAYAPTPALIRQLAAGAPADILLVADPAWMDEAVRQDLVQPGTRSNLLANDLVLAGPNGSVSAGTLTSDFAMMALLGRGRLAMCDPDQDPAGRYAKQALQTLGFWPMVAHRIAIAESSPAAVVLVDHNEAAAAVCFKTDLYGDEHAVIVGTFPANSHSPILYPVALARDVRVARAVEVLAFLRGAAAMKIFARFGYTTQNAA